MLNTETLKTLGNEWIKGDHHRVYFDVREFCPEFDELSNAQRNKLASVKLWYDVHTGTFHYKSFDDVAYRIDLTIAAIKAAATDPEPAQAAPVVAPEYAPKVVEAVATGKQILLHYHMTDCDSPGEDCDTDSVETYAMPDGSVQTFRSHSW